MNIPKERQNSLLYNYKPSRVILSTVRPEESTQVLCCKDTHTGMRPAVEVDKKDIPMLPVNIQIFKKNKKITNMAGEYFVMFSSSYFTGSDIPVALYTFFDLEHLADFLSLHFYSDVPFYLNIFCVKTLTKDISDEKYVQFVTNIYSMISLCSERLVNFSDTEFDDTALNEYFTTPKNYYFTLYKEGKNGVYKTNCIKAYCLADAYNTYFEYCEKNLPDYLQYLCSVTNEEIFNKFVNATNLLKENSIKTSLNDYLYEDDNKETENSFEFLVNAVTELKDINEKDKTTLLSIAKNMQKGKRRIPKKYELFYKYMNNITKKVDFDIFIKCFNKDGFIFGGTCRNV